MNEANTDSEPAHTDERRGWFKRLGQALLGPRDREQLVALLRDAEQRNLLDADALLMIEGVLAVSEMRVRDIMVPRSQMAVVERDAHPRAILPVVIESAHSRFPVIGESKDEVVGILLAKDLLAYFAEEGGENFQVRDVVRPAVFIPESKRLNVLLREFRASRNHMAIVVDEYGGVAGLVTIEDVLEEIVGEIADEHDIEDEDFITEHSATNFTVQALTPIQEFNQRCGADFSDEEFDTIGGVLMHHFGRLPKRGETLSLGRLRFKVLRADSRRLHLIQVSLRPPADEKVSSAA